MSNVIKKRHGIAKNIHVSNAKGKRIILHSGGFISANHPNIKYGISSVRYDHDS